MVNQLTLITNDGQIEMSVSWYMGTTIIFCNNSSAVSDVPLQTPTAWRLCGTVNSPRIAFSPPYFADGVTVSQAFAMLLHSTH